MGLISNMVALIATAKGVAMGVAIGAMALAACEARRRTK